MVAGYMRVKRTGFPWGRQYLSLEGGLLSIREREGANATQAARGENITDPPPPLSLSISAVLSLSGYMYNPSLLWMLWTLWMLWMPSRCRRLACK